MANAELVAVTADLPDVAEVAAETKDFVQIDVHGGSAVRRSRWVVPQRMEIGAVGGSVKLDFTDAVINGPTMDIEAEVKEGRLVLVTRLGIEVDLEGVAARGGRVKVRHERDAKEPTFLMISVFGAAHGGEVIMCQARRIFGPQGRAGL